TAYAYDSLGRRIRRTLPLGMSEAASYDGRGRLTTRTDFNGNITTYEYDAVDRLVRIVPDARFDAPPITFSYNAAGLRLTMSDGSGVTTYTYDVRDRVLSKATPEGTLKYTYDPAGNLTGLASSNSQYVGVNYTYDALNRLVSVRDDRQPVGANTTTYSYDGNGNQTSVLYPNGVNTSLTYDALNRLRGISTAGLSHTVSYDYSLGPSRKRKALTESAGRSVGYSYDVLSRLTAEAISGGPSGVNGTVTYEYDFVGNRLGRTSTLAPISSDSHTYDANDRMVGTSYDSNGNILASAGHSYA